MTQEELIKTSLYQNQQSPNLKRKTLIVSIILVLFSMITIGFFVAQLIGIATRKSPTQSTPTVSPIITTKITTTVQPFTTSTQQRRTCKDENDCAGSPCEGGYCQGIGEGADCIDGYVKVCQAGVCDCQKK